MSALLIGSAGLLALAAVGAAVSHRYSWWRSTVDHRRPRILMYHMIRAPVAGARFNKLRVSPAAFERQLAWLAQDGWTFAFLSEAWEGGPCAAKTVVLTFDDGYRDNYSAADPLLRKYGAKATLFLVADRFDRDWSKTKKAHHDSGELAAEPKLANADVRHGAKPHPSSRATTTFTDGAAPEAAHQTVVHRRELARSSAACASSTSLEGGFVPRDFPSRRRFRSASCADSRMPRTSSVRAVPPGGRW